jgi:hypothetical protein
VDQGHGARNEVQHVCDKGGGDLVLLRNQAWPTEGMEKK